MYVYIFIYMYAYIYIYIYIYVVHRYTSWRQNYVEILYVFIRVCTHVCVVCVYVWCFFWVGVAYTQRYLSICAYTYWNVEASISVKHIYENVRLYI